MTMSFDAQTLLLVEDNEDDVFIFKRAFRQAGIKNPVQVVQDGEEASDYLFGRGRFADRATYPLPGMVFLDLKLPLRSGLEVLQALREDPALANLCVVVLTSSAEERDVTRAQELAAHAYLVKPPNATLLNEVLTAVRARLAGGERSSIPRISGDRFEESAMGSRAEVVE